MSTPHADSPANAPPNSDDLASVNSKRLARLKLHMPVDVRSASLALIAFILSLYALHWSREIVVPILCGVMVSYALAPIVNRMVRLRIPRAAAATVLLSAIVGTLAWGAWALGDQTDALIETVPSVTAKIRELSRRASDKTSTIKRMQNAAADLAAATAAQQPLAPGRPAQPSADAFDVRTYLLTGAIGAMAFAGKIAVILFVALFLLCSGNSFRRKMVKIAGPKLSQKKVTIQTLDEITEQIQRFLLVQVGVSVVVGVLTWLAFMALGLNNAAVWGAVAGLTNLIPYVGALLVGGASAVVALVQFGTPGMALAIAAASFAIHTVVGNVLTPLWMGRASKMSAVAVFITVLVFGWLWGVWGLLLGVPILLVVKSVCDRVDDLKPIGELLGA
jgi:predicted PurR-regulated permease PerM